MSTGTPLSPFAVCAPSATNVVWFRKPLVASRYCFVCAPIGVTSSATANSPSRQTQLRFVFMSIPRICHRSCPGCGAMAISTARHCACSPGLGDDVLSQLAEVDGDAAEHELGPV